MRLKKSQSCSANLLYVIDERGLELGSIPFLSTVIRYLVVLRAESDRSGLELRVARIAALTITQSGNGRGATSIVTPRHRGGCRASRRASFLFLSSNSSRFSFLELLLGCFFTLALGLFLNLLLSASHVFLPFQFLKFIQRKVSPISLNKLT